MKMRPFRRRDDQASSQQVQVGEVRLGAVNIGRLTLSQVHMAGTTGTIRLCGVSVSLGLSFGLDWTFSLKIDGLELLPSFIVRRGHINIGALAMNIPLADISLDGLDKLAFNLKSTTAKDVKATVAPSRSSSWATWWPSASRLRG